MCRLVGVDVEGEWNGMVGCNIEDAGLTVGRLWICCHHCWGDELVLRWAKKEGVLILWFCELVWPFRWRGSSSSASRRVSGTQPVWPLCDPVWPVPGDAGAEGVPVGLWAGPGLSSCPAHLLSRPLLPGPRLHLSAGAQSRETQEGRRGSGQGTQVGGADVGS